MANSKTCSIIVVVATLSTFCRSPSGASDSASREDLIGGAVPKLTSSSEEALKHAAGDFLTLLKSDFRAAMDMIPPKFNASNGPVVAHQFFTEDERSSGDFVVKKDLWRVENIFCVNQPNRQACLQDEGSRAAIAGDDRPELVVDAKVMKWRTLEEMEANGLRSGQVSGQPWSDDYWAIYKGMLGVRYADADFPKSQNWKANRDYIEAHPVTEIVASGEQSRIDLLSPSEKFDLLLGDDQFTLTNMMWNKGKAYYDVSNKVETWMGICHGWAAASYMLKRPKNAITLTAADGQTKIRFFPSDIKAYGSLLWANGLRSTMSMGGRCDDKNPMKDDNGRITSQKCFDNNPGSFHMAVVNQIGQGGQRSLVLDATYDYEVWNQPILSYSYSYFNPETKEIAEKLEDAVVSIEEFQSDKFKPYRSAGAKKVAGITMNLTYMVETGPTHRLEDSDVRDAKMTVQYTYDVELDANDQIVGGEWYSNKHPDFLWTAPAAHEISSPNNGAASGNWSGIGPLPKTWQKAGQEDSRSSLPLPKLVYKLVEMSHAGSVGSVNSEDDPSDSAGDRQDAPLAECKQLTDGSWLPWTQSIGSIVDVELVRQYYQSGSLSPWVWGVNAAQCNVLIRDQKNGKICSVGGPLAAYSTLDGKRLSNPLTTYEQCLEALQ